MPNFYIVFESWAIYIYIYIYEPLYVVIQILQNKWITMIILPTSFIQQFLHFLLKQKRKLWWDYPTSLFCKHLSLVFLNRGGGRGRGGGHIFPQSQLTLIFPNTKSLHISMSYVLKFSILMILNTIFCLIFLTVPDMKCSTLFPRTMGQLGSCQPILTGRGLLSPLQILLLQVQLTYPSLRK